MDSICRTDVSLPSSVDLRQLTAGRLPVPEFGRLINDETITVRCRPSAQTSGSRHRVYERPGWRKIERARASIERFLDQHDPDDEMFLYGFASDVRLFRIGPDQIVTR